MEVPAQIDFQGMEPSPKLRERAEELIGKLEKRWGHIISCRVAIKAPSEHHKTSGQYEVHVELSLPDRRSVVAARTPPADERFRDPRFALDEAFKRARRQLEEQVEVLEGDVKSHEAAPMGTVIKIDRAEGFGFIRTADDREIYFHRNSVIEHAFDKLDIGSHVSFVEGLGIKGPQASTVKPVGKHSLRA